MWIRKIIFAHIVFAVIARVFEPAIRSRTEERFIAFAAIEDVMMGTVLENRLIACTNVVRPVGRVLRVVESALP